MLQLRIGNIAKSNYGIKQRITRNNTKKTLNTRTSIADTADDINFKFDAENRVFFTNMTALLAVIKLQKPASSISKTRGWGTKKRGWGTKTRGWRLKYADFDNGSS